MQVGTYSLRSPSTLHLKTCSTEIKLLGLYLVMVTTSSETEQELILFAASGRYHKATKRMYKQLLFEDMSGRVLRGQSDYDELVIRRLEQREDTMGGYHI